MTAETKKPTGAAGFLFIIVVVAIVAAYFGGTIYSNEPSSNGGFVGYSVSPAKTIVTSQTSGLELILATNTSMLISGQAISVNISEFNTLSLRANLSRSGNDWPVRGLSLGVCNREGFGNYPMGLGVVKGFYTDSNVSDISSNEILQLYEPYYGPQYGYIMYSFTYFSFQPMSDIAWINACTAPTGCSYSISWINNSNGSWVASNASGNITMFQTFAPGVYSLIGGDEWGNLALLHFMVKSA